MLTVGKLKKLISELEDSTPIIYPGTDHNYYPAKAFVTTALFNGFLNGRHLINEDYGEDVTPEKEYGKRKIALVLE